MARGFKFLSFFTGLFGAIIIIKKEIIQPGHIFMIGFYG